jgi:hypothetical protein
MRDRATQQPAEHPMSHPLMERLMSVLADNHRRDDHDDVRRDRSLKAISYPIPAPDEREQGYGERGSRAVLH